ncbi:Transcriptional regulator, XRE family [Pediococcus damnosus]|uniref:Transcriptional regulator, XRE family n=1 Tax=Pediococcus damnosus TaxID=51663 RepID=A0A0R2HL02_9LACO|nr:helix-turn-helix transcriptional regulator [Pediococcus damnosus]AMV63081.1 Transcriptional regulator, XRE family [Pediococcus damnosus]AMV64764.1 Transcriptional regulator, XRE family [Pediococcus damnosus]AMV67028.1 Transcriptional regulator, XRE family [Pediococcus damnosus]AMV69369.1 Transcriptional regulator, XRE family [Pediococcus damnosus]KJU74377.1 XRE family transcriptional regulator [Pediococcus damnosus LMG 28219]
MADANFGQMLKQFRKQRGFTQQVLAEQLYVSRKTVSSWETGRNFPDIEMVSRLATLLNVTTDELMGRKQVRPKNKTWNIGIALAVLITGRLIVATTVSMLLFSDLLIALLILLLVLFLKRKLGWKELLIGSSLLALVLFVSAWRNLFLMNFSLQVVYTLTGCLLSVDAIYYWGFKLKFI